MSSTPLHPETLAPKSYYTGKYRRILLQLNSFVETNQINLLSFAGLEWRLTTSLLPTLEPYLKHSNTRKILELASGTGVHVVLYAQHHPKLNFQPTECDEYNCTQVDQLVQEKSVGDRVKKARILDVEVDADWQKIEVPEGGFDLVLGSNFIHMVPLCVRTIAGYHIC